MAIIKELGLEVQILIGGKAVKEYPDLEPDIKSLNLGPDTKTSHCYIECQENMQFAIRSEVPCSENLLARWLETQENLVYFRPSFNGGPYLRGVLVRAPGVSIHHNGVMNLDDGTIQNLRFSTVSTVEVTDEQSVAKDIETAKSLGLLTIGVWRVREPRKESSGEEIDTTGLSEGCLALAEAALKGEAISIGTSLSSPSKTTECLRYSYISYVDSEDQPLAVFVFKYRTREDLQKAMIIPRPKVSSPELVIAKERQEPATSLHPRARSKEVVTDHVRNLSYEEALHLARERLECLPLEEVFKLFGQEFKEIPLGSILRLAGERLTKLSLQSVLRLASERLKDTRGQEKTSVNIKSEGPEGPEGRHSGQSSGTSARIKRRREKELQSERASKHR